MYRGEEATKTKSVFQTDLMPLMFKKAKVISLFKNSLRLEKWHKADARRIFVRMSNFQTFLKQQYFYLKSLIMDFWQKPSSVKAIKLSLDINKKSIIFVA